MNFDEENYIPGIHNWCDRWCEKCAFITKCSVGAVELDMQETSPEEAMERFWDRLSEKMENSPHQEAFEEMEIDPEWEKEYEAKENLKNIIVDTHPLPDLAHEYGISTKKWIDSNGVRKQIANLPVGNDDISAQDCLDIINFYQFFIPAKCARMISEKEDEIWEDYEVHERSYNGTAKITLITIDRSISAFIILLTKLSRESESITKKLAQLQQLKRMIEGEFPDAQKFIRPGFDE